MENSEKETIEDVKTILKSRKYLTIGSLMIAIGVVLAFVLYDWKLALILFLIVQGNEVTQKHNNKINNIVEKFTNKIDNYKE
jgi:uncharacterized membrane protein